MDIRTAQIKKVLIIQIRPYGDVLLNTAYLPELQQRLPTARIDFLVQAPYHHLVADSHYLNDKKSNSSDVLPNANTI